MTSYSILALIILIVTPIIFQSIFQQSLKRTSLNFKDDIKKNNYKKTKYIMLSVYYFIEIVSIIFCYLCVGELIVYNMQSFKSYSGIILFFLIFLFMFFLTYLCIFGDNDTKYGYPIAHGFAMGFLMIVILLCFYCGVCDDLYKKTIDYSKYDKKDEVKIDLETLYNSDTYGLLKCTAEDNIFIYSYMDKNSKEFVPIPYSLDTFDIIYEENLKQPYVIIRKYKAKFICYKQNIEFYEIHIPQNSSISIQ